MTSAEFQEKERQILARCTAESLHVKLPKPFTRAPFNIQDVINMKPREESTMTVMAEGGSPTTSSPTAAANHIHDERHLQVDPLQLQSQGHDQDHAHHRHVRSGSYVMPEERRVKPRLTPIPE